MTRPEAGPKDGFPPGKADTKAPVRVVIIEDSELQKEALRGICEEGEQLQVIATAPTGRAGVEAVLKLQPDLILCDLNLPDIDGFEVITEIMSERATPILVVTASLRPPGRRDAFDALGLGAVDVIEKPNSAMLANETWRERFRQQLRVIARTRVIPHVMGRVRHRFQKSRSEPLPFVKPRLLVIVASAGGPQAVQMLLTSMIPALPLSVPTIVALHLGAPLSGSYATHLSRVLGIDTTELTDGMLLKPGIVHVAPGGRHTAMSSAGRASLCDHLEGARFVPSFDHLLESVAAHFGATAAGVVLTGMGSDGARGLLALRQAGGLTLTQDQQSSVVYGMPRAAYELGASKIALPPEGIGRVLLDWLQASEERAR